MLVFTPKLDQSLYQSVLDILTSEHAIQQVYN